MMSASPNELANIASFSQSENIVFAKQMHHIAVGDASRTLAPPPILCYSTNGALIMIFKFNIRLTDEDYLEFNKFWMMRSNYGKKQMLFFRIVLVVMMVIFSFISLYGGGFSAEAFLGIIPHILLLVLMQLCFAPVISFTLKSQIKSLKKSGKMGYSPNSVMEFYDDCFVEATDENEIKQKYSAIERVSVITGRNIYIHVNNIMAYILPWYCFDDDEQREVFIEFIKSKCENIDVYQ